MFTDVFGNDIVEGDEVLAVFAHVDKENGDVNTLAGTVINTYPGKIIVDVDVESKKLIQRYLKTQCVKANTAELTLHTLSIDSSGILKLPKIKSINEQ